MHVRVCIWAWRVIRTEIKRSPSGVKQRPRTKPLQTGYLQPKVKNSMIKSRCVLARNENQCGHTLTCDGQQSRGTSWWSGPTAAPRRHRLPIAGCSDASGASQMTKCHRHDLSKYETSHGGGNAVSSEGDRRAQLPESDLTNGLANTRSNFTAPLEPRNQQEIFS